MGDTIVNHGFRHRIAEDNLAKLKAIGYLSCQRLKQLFHVDANVVRADGLMALPLVEVVWEDDALHQVDDFLHLFHRGK